MKTKIILAIAATAIMSLPAQAQDMYVSGQFGIRAVEDTDASLAGADIQLELANASYFSGAIGRRMENWRFEAEFSRRGGKFNALTINGTDTASNGDGLGATALMANAIYDFSPEARWSGYVGAGLGMARISADFNGAGGSIEGDASAAALQLIGGVSYALSESTQLVTDVRYFRAGETDYTLSAPLGSSSVSFQYDGYTLGAGLRVAF